MTLNISPPNIRIPNLKDNHNLSMGTPYYPARNDGDNTSQVCVTLHYCVHEYAINRDKIINLAALESGATSSPGFWFEEELRYLKGSTKVYMSHDSYPNKYGLKFAGGNEAHFKKGIAYGMDSYGILRYIERECVHMYMQPK
ncbi:unnamed protein product [Hermetia illucens]|uniref:Uncharacterized protein n=1 Tax=Hermetia illucens TaxID=343691 RepID=A0A7R8UKN2_HERIL|nr:unnamed protein product [Hermetia illucens]